MSEISCGTRSTCDILALVLCTPPTKLVSQSGCRRVQMASLPVEQIEDTVSIGHKAKRCLVNGPSLLGSGQNRASHESLQERKPTKSHFSI